MFPSDAQPNPLGPKTEAGGRGGVLRVKTRVSGFASRLVGDGASCCQRSACAPFAVVLGVLLMTSLPQSGYTVVLDWDSVSWTAESLTQSYDIDPVNPGNDIRITITGDTTRFEPDYPADDQALTGGLSPTEENLHLRVEFQNPPSQQITVTVEFLYTVPVLDVSFTLFDIDIGRTAGPFHFYLDQIRDIKANLYGGPDIPATVTGSASNTVSGSGTLAATATGTGPAGDNTSDGNVTIDFGTNLITQFSFTYGNAEGALPSSKPQDIGFHDIRYRPIPEFHPRLFAAFACVLLACWRQMRRLCSP